MSHFSGSITCRGKGIFNDKRNHTWSSHMSWAVFSMKLDLPAGEKYDAERHEHLIVIKKVHAFGQLPKTGGGGYVRPFFRRAELKRMKAYCVRHFVEHVVERRDGDVVQLEPDVEEISEDTFEEAQKHHMSPLCERCQTTGVPCTGMVEVLEGVYVRIKNRKKFSKRIHKLRRVKKQWNEHGWDAHGRHVVPQGCKILYHQTDEAAAQSIVASQEMRRGTTGMYGGGIYFAVSPAATEGKALHRGPVLECVVYLGNIKEVGAPDGALSFTEVRKEGFDSVRGINHPSNRECDEYIVYNRDQVLAIRRLPT